jgi:hypothetical protein
MLRQKRFGFNESAAERAQNTTPRYQLPLATLAGQN